MYTYEDHNKNVHPQDHTKPLHMRMIKNMYTYERTIEDLYTYKDHREPCDHRELVHLQGS